MRMREKSLADFAGPAGQKRNGAQMSDEAVTAEAGRIGFGPGQRDIAGDVRREPDPVTVDEAYLRARQYAVPVDEGPVGRPLVADRGPPAVVDHHGCVPP